METDVKVYRKCLNNCLDILKDSKLGVYEKNNLVYAEIRKVM